MALISVVIPVYKVKDYLSRCVNSVLSQTFKSFDLILIDDGSPDECGEICDNYAKKDDRVNVIHQSNQGLSGARNAGIEWAMKNSDSEWITFIDSDDWVHIEYLRLLYESAQYYRVDLCIVNCLKTSSLEADNYIPKESVRAFEPEEFWCFRQLGSACGKLYRKKHFRDIRFPIGLLYEDIFVTYRLIFMQTKLIYLEDPLYFYFNRDGSITRSKWNPRLMDQICGMKQQMNYFKKNHYYNALVITKKNLLFDIWNQYESAKLLRKEYFKEYLRLKFQFKYYLVNYHKLVPIQSNTNLYRSGLPFITKIYKKYTYLYESKANS